MAEIPSSIIDDILQSKLSAHGLDYVEAKAGVDHDGEPALFIDAVLKPNSQLVGGKIYAEVLGALSDALLKHGERRFPYLFLRHPDEERAEP
jgi:hypothetical protein